MSSTSSNEDKKTQNEETLGRLRISLAGDDLNRFSEAATVLEKWCSGHRAYYSKARPEIIRLLEIALGSVSRCCGTSSDAFHISRALDHAKPWVELYERLIRSVAQFYLFFKDSPLESRLRVLIGTIAADVDQFLGQLNLVQPKHSSVNRPPSQSVQGSVTPSPAASLSPVPSSSACEVQPPPKQKAKKRKVDFNDDFIKADLDWYQRNQPAHVSTTPDTIAPDSQSVCEHTPPTLVQEELPSPLPTKKPKKRRKGPPGIRALSLLRIEGADANSSSPLIPLIASVPSTSAPKSLAQDPEPRSEEPSLNSTDRLKSIPPVAVLETGELVGSPEPMSVDEEVAGPHDKGRDAVIKAEENEEEKEVDELLDDALARGVTEVTSTTLEETSPDAPVQSSPFISRSIRLLGVRQGHSSYTPKTNPIEFDFELSPEECEQVSRWASRDNKKADDLSGSMTISFVCYSYKDAYPPNFDFNQPFDIEKCGHPAQWPVHPYDQPNYIVINTADELVRSPQIRYAPPFQMPEEDNIIDLAAYGLRPGKNTMHMFQSTDLSEFLFAIILHHPTAAQLAAFAAARQAEREWQALYDRMGVIHIPPVSLPVPNLRHLVSGRS